MSIPTLVGYLCCRSKGVSYSNDEVSSASELFIQERTLNHVIVSVSCEFVA